MLQSGGNLGLESTIPSGLEQSAIEADQSLRSAAKATNPKHQTTIMIRKLLSRFAVAALAGGLMFTTNFTPAEESSPWRFDASLNLFLAGMGGDVTAKGVPAHVDTSFKNIFEHLEAAAAGRFTLGYENWFLSTEVSYLRIGAEVPAADFGLEQWLVEPAVGYGF